MSTATKYVKTGSTPIWVVEWFDPEKWQMGSFTAKSRQSADCIVSAHQEVGWPTRVTESEIEHWTEEPA